MAGPRGTHNCSLRNEFTTGYELTTEASFDKEQHRK